ncbi:iron uptake porin [Leptolyngbya boryana CZ1]|uniref:Iron uptake porin n=1 Tax=Leptolyngbya boryana CZ1 TaxID=3060204 RepID=A0AA96WTD2_LEPBY|nr:iron uptake porin [Leptolyngbya boryana]WNZ45435.1 iron uptake porin [Leptolyngbya boryana CZ1]
MLSRVTLLSSFAITAISLIAVPPAKATPIAEISQVTSVSQLSGVQPTDWAFQALQSLVERYGCIAGYPDRTFRGNRALTRYEFAAGLNACLDRVNELISAATADLVKKEDLAMLQKLQEQFGAELDSLRGRVDALEARTSQLEKQQFSTTTKLTGESIIALTNVFGGSDLNGQTVDRNPTLSHRTRLNFDTSFTGKDLLRVRLQASNVSAISNLTGTPEGELSFAPGFQEQEGSEIELNALSYQFPVSDRTTVFVSANDGESEEFAESINPFFDGDGGRGSISQFGTRNPIYYLLEGTGAGITHKLNDTLELSVGYLASDADTPTGGNGLFDGAYGAIAQLTIEPSEAWAFGITYIHAYNTDYTTEGSAGSLNANLFTATGRPTVTNSFGLQASFRPSTSFIVNGWVGYTGARVLELGDANIWNWAVTLGFPDLGKKGNFAGLVIGMEPKLTRIDSAITAATGVERDRNTSLHLEAFYQHQITDHLAITPGLIWLTAPNHDQRNQDLIIGTIRTTFTF